MTKIPEQHPNPVVRHLLFFFGWVTFVLGIIGLLLPVVPTSPFMILSAVCFLRSSPRFYHWLTDHPVFGIYVRYYLSGEGMPERVKLTAITLLWIMMLVTALLIIEQEWLSTLLLSIAMLVSIYIVGLPEPEEDL